MPKLIQYSRIVQTKYSEMNSAMRVLRDKNNIDVIIYANEIKDNDEYTEIGESIEKLDNTKLIYIKFDNSGETNYRLSIGGLNRLFNMLISRNIKSVSLKNLRLCTTTMISFFKLAFTNPNIKKLKLVPTNILHEEIDMKTEKNIQLYVGYSRLSYLKLKDDMLLPCVIDGISENDDLQYVDLSMCYLVPSDLSVDYLDMIKSAYSNLKMFKAPYNYKDYDYSQIVDNTISEQEEAPTTIVFNYKKICWTLIKFVLYIILMIFALGMYFERNF